MNNLSRYIIEKLKINKEEIENASKKEIRNFMVIFELYNKKNSINFWLFNDYDVAMKFIKRDDIYFLDGYCFNDKQWYEAKETIDKDPNPEHLFKSSSNFMKYVKENNILPILKYNQI